MGALRLLTLILMAVPTLLGGKFVLPGEPNWTFPFTINQHLSIIRNFKDSSRIIHYKSAALFVSLLPEIERVRRNLLWTGWVAPAL